MKNEAAAMPSAQDLARSLLAGHGSRWAHVQGVAARANELDVSEDVINAAWLHDIGYADLLRDTGMHAIDGALFLRREGWPPVICGLVARHTGAAIEAEERHLIEALDEFPDPPRELLDALTLCDLTVAPDGTESRISERLGEILARYPEGHPVHAAVRRSRPHLELACRRAIGALGLAEGWGLSAL